MMKNKKYIIAAVSLLLTASCSKREEIKVDSTGTGADAVSASLQSNISGTRPELIQKVVQMKSEIAARNPGLEQQRDRQGKLVSELMQDDETGCFANVTLDNVEVIAYGSHLGRKDLGSANNPITEDDGGASTMTYKFSDNITFSSDEELDGLMLGRGRKVVTDLAGLKLGEIKELKIIKEGAGYDNEQRTKSKSGFFGIGASKKTYYQNFEINRYQLNRIEFKVNGETFYRNDNIGHIFEKDITAKGGYEWSDPNFKLNEYWLKLMRRQDCPQ